MSSAGDKWSATSGAYSQRIVQVTSQGGEALLQLVESSRRFDDNSKVLDSGAGSGALTNLLRQRCASMPIVAADVAPGMLEQLAKRDLPNVKTMVVDATKDYVTQGLQTGEFSHVVSTFMLQFISPAQTAINESFRVLQPGGVIGSAIWSQNLVGEPWNIACKNLDPSFEPLESKTIFSEAFKSTQDLEAAYATAGFVDARSSETGMYLTFESAEAFADYFIFSKNPPFVVMQSTWKGKVEDVRDELAKVTRERYDNGRLYMVAACSVARKPEK